MSPPLSDEQTARVERHTQLVRTVAARVAARVGVMSVDELASVGNEALVRSALRYDPAGEASFATFAHYRIHGAMIDAVRKRTPGRRKQKRALQRLELTQALLSEAAGDADARRAAGQVQSLEQRVETARDIVRRAALAVCLSEPDSAQIDTVAAPTADPEQRLLDADARARMWSLIDGLGREQRELIEALYSKGKSMRELADQAGCSVATISRRHSRILDELGRRAREQEWTPAP